MSYKETEPCLPLRPYVQCFWQALRGPSTPPFLIVPDAAVDLIFRFDWEDGRVVRARAFLSGVMTRPHRVETRGTHEWLGVRFRSGCARLLVKVPLHETADLELDPSEFLSRSVAPHPRLPAHCG